MKTFEQFLSEAGAPSREETAIRRFFERGGRGTSKQGRIAKENEQNAREAADAERAARGLPSGTSATRPQQEIARQLAAQKAQQQREAEQRLAAQKAEREKQNTLSQAAQRLAAQRASETPEEKAARIKREKAIAKSARRAARTAQQNNPQT